MLPQTSMRDAALARSLLWRWSARGVWLGSIAFALSLLGTELLRHESLRIRAVLSLLGAGVLAVLAWSDSRWSAAFPTDWVNRLDDAHLQAWRRRSALATLAGAVLLSGLSHVAFLAAPRDAFGLTGWLWLAGITGVIAAAALRPVAHARQNNREADGPPAWTWWEVAVVVSIAALALALRVWDLRDFPFNIYPDEIMTGSVAERAYVSGPSTAPCLFSTLWGDVELPALWFAIVAGALKLGGIGLATVRLPAALFGAATVLPFYGLVRGVWGRIAAIAGASILGRVGRRCERTFLLRDAPAAVHFDSVCGLSLGGSLVRSPTIPQTDRVADIGIPDWLWAAAELLRNAPGLVLRPRRRSDDLEPDTDQLA